MLSHPRRGHTCEEKIDWNYIITSRMHITHTASVTFSQFLSFLLFTGGGGSRHMHYLANVPGLEHFLAKDPPPPQATALFGLPARGMQSIFELPACWRQILGQD